MQKLYGIQQTFKHFDFNFFMFRIRKYDPPSCGTGLEKVTTLKALNQNKLMIFSVGTEELWVNTKQLKVPLNHL